MTENTPNFDEILTKQLIDDQDPQIVSFQEDFYGDFYDYFVNLLKFKQLSQGISDEEMAQKKLSLYLDIFRSQDFPGKKTYRYCLTFDRKLNFLKEESDFTLSALTRDLKKQPDQVGDYLAVREQVLAGLANRLNGQEGNARIQTFNEVLADIYDKYRLNRFKIAYRLH